jgi:hypothetical protein
MAPTRLVLRRLRGHPIPTTRSLCPSTRSKEPRSATVSPFTLPVDPHLSHVHHSAISIRTFLDNTSSQLTYYGLFDLASTVRPGQLVALFRNSHLSVLYKPPVAAPRDPFSDSAPAKTDAEAPLIDLSPADQSPEPHFASHNPFAAKASAEYERRHPHPPADTDTNTSTSGTAHANSGAGVGADANTLYTLVTDASFVREPTVVWEALRDVDGHTAAFVDAHFAPAAPAGGDFSGALADEMAALAVVDDHE